jgi:mannose-1-phosphate guanylyltransferase/mannose-6-phosphate isomerase
MAIKPVILCGGSGTRLWPLSSRREPKQFLRLASERSMLQDTALRVSDRARFQRPLAIGSARHAGLLHSALPDADILLEPHARNSAPPIAAACLLCEPEDLILILPADHHIGRPAAFLEAIARGESAALQAEIVTFGIEPDHAATGYGYIEAEGDAELRKVSRFVEKPDLATAEAYLASGRFFWNAGIFLFQASVMLEAFKAHAPDILHDVEEALDGPFLSPHHFARVRSQSIDYAILEHADNISVVPVSMEWGDLGDFRALHEAEAGEWPNRNVTFGPVATQNTQNIFVHSQGPWIALQGVENIAVVATPEAVLVTTLDQAAEIKDVTSRADNPATHALKAEQRDWLSHWLWQRVMPHWAAHAIDPATGSAVEAIEFSGAPASSLFRRGRVGPRQLYAFASARQRGWNPNGAADVVIEACLRHLGGPARARGGGWVHGFNGDGSVNDARRDLYDHAFIALAGSQLLMEGDRRGGDLADEAFAFIDSFFREPVHGGWHDPETAPGQRRANPHMHLLEASLLHYEASFSPASLDRIAQIATLFERWMFDPETDGLIEDLAHDWARPPTQRIEPGHCYEWAYLLEQCRRVTGRDTGSWCRRLIGFAERHGLQGGLVIDRYGNPAPTFRLWPQLERLRALAAMPRPDVDLPAITDGIIDNFLKPGPDHGWVDHFDQNLEPLTTLVPASMIYHLVTNISVLLPQVRDADRLG